MVKVLLIVVQGKPEGRSIPVTGPVFKIGRGVDCHLRPNSEEVSRLHTEITLTETEAIVRDLGSRNGTWVNGQLLQAPHKLSSGELLKIGPLTFAVAIQGSVEEVAAPTPPAVTPTPPPTPTPMTGARVRALDEVPNIDAWLVADQNKPAPERPSGVYAGDTLTLESFRQTKGSSGSIPTPPPAPTISPLEVHLEGIEMLPEGAGDGFEASNNEAEGEDDDAAAADHEWKAPEEEELIDENNPFYAAKKAAASAAASAAAQPVAPAGPAKAESSKDSSQAANDILRKMMDRRRSS